MPQTKRDHLRDAIRASLVGQVGSTPSAPEVGVAVLGAWRQAGERLSRLIGPRGVGVLLQRALHLASSDFAWLAPLSTQEPDAIAALEESLSKRAPTESLEAGISVLLHFSELLSTLIGTSLSDQLLTPVWATQRPSSNKERLH
jgi:hypothetical protein